MEGAHYKLRRFKNIKEFNNLFKFPASLYKPRDRDIQPIKENENAINQKIP